MWRRAGLCRNSDTRIVARIAASSAADMCTRCVNSIHDPFRDVGFRIQALGFAETAHDIGLRCNGLRIDGTRTPRTTGTYASANASHCGSRRRSSQRSPSGIGRSRWTRTRSMYESRTSSSSRRLGGCRCAWARSSSVVPNGGLDRGASRFRRGPASSRLRTTSASRAAIPTALQSRRARSSDGGRSHARPAAPRRPRL